MEYWIVNCYTLSAAENEGKEKERDSPYKSIHSHLFVEGVHHEVEGLLLFIKQNQLAEVNSIHLKSHPIAEKKNLSTTAKNIALQYKLATCLLYPLIFGPWVTIMDNFHQKNYCHLHTSTCT